MNPIIKWPGGKSRELSKVLDMIPAFTRYVEPFFGGGALYFHLTPEKAAINDVSGDLMQFYRLVKEQDPMLQNYLRAYGESFSNLVATCDANISRLVDIFTSLYTGAMDEGELSLALQSLIGAMAQDLQAGFRQPLVLSWEAFEAQLLKMSIDKFTRTVANHQKKPFTQEDLQENLITGFTSGYFMYFRDIFNDIQLGRRTDVSQPYASANFYFIREYCYGSMFRYNARGEFNIPYGGMSYNRKDMGAKIDTMFCPDIEKLFSQTKICSTDFESFLNSLQLTEDDFLFLDPPYDSDFSDYEGKAFTKLDQARLAVFLSRTKAKFILIIKNTDFIKGLYENGNFRVLRFDKQYTYNVRSRNTRGTQHLIVTNLPE